MQVMILEEDPTLRTQIAGALAPQGVNILSVGRLAKAKEIARREAVDILVLGESVQGRLAHDVALLAEWRNPRVGSILLSNREGEEADELFELIPSLQAVLARRTGPQTLARVALAAAQRQGVRLEAEGSASLEEEPIALPAEAILEETPAAPEPVALLPLAAEEVPAHLEPELLVQEPDMTPPEPEPVRADEAPSNLLYVLPRFLREEEADEPEDEPLPTPHPAVLASRFEAPMRRLHLA